MWHDIGKTSPSSIEFGTPHGEKVWRVWKAGLLPKEIKLAKRVAKAIKVHETLDPRKLFFKVKNRLRLVSPPEIKWIQMWWFPWIGRTNDVFQLNTLWYKFIEACKFDK